MEVYFEDLFYIFILVVLYLASAFSTAYAQTNWAKDSGNPVLSPITSSNWEDYGVYAPFVLKHGDTLKMWYTGIKSFGVQQIGYATSMDGINWQRDSHNPVLRVGAPGSWDAEYVGYPKIILVDTTYHMWYAGSNDLNNQIFRMGHATSTDGITWTKYNDPSTINPPFANSDPVLTPTPGSWDSATLAGHSYFFDGDSFNVWYVGSDNLTTRRYKIGYAKSYDGITWEKYPENPVFYGAGSWDSLKVHGPCVIVDSSGYQMWYQGKYGSNYRIGYATSLDGINWIALDTFVLDIGNPGTWEDKGVGAHHIFLDDTTYKMWYTGWDYGTPSYGYHIGYATTPINSKQHQK